jgi:predicted dehydrogenase
MKDTLNIGLVGYKFMGKAHSNGFTQMPLFFEPGATVVKKAICGRDEAGVMQAMVKFGWESYETDYKKLAARKDIDAIDVTAPSNYHKPIVMEAIAQGKHVFCEKPLALNLADAREMLGAAKKAGIKHQIGFNYRFAPAIKLAKKLIDEGRIGKIYHFRGKYLQDWIIDPEFPMVWRLDKSICGSGTLGDLGAHVIDLAAYLVGDIKEVTGMSKTFIKKRPIVTEMSGLSGKAEADAPMGDVTVDDATAFCAEFECGALGTFETTRFAAGHKNDMSFEINGEKGSLKFEFERMNELWYCDYTEDAETQGFKLIQASDECHSYAGDFWPVGHVLGYENTFVAQMYEFAKAIANDEDAAPGFDAGVKVAQIMDAVDLSIKRRAWVDVKSL